MTDGSTPDGSTADGSVTRPTRVVAQGTFDLLHPGHVGYLERAAATGDELHVIVARSASVTHEPVPVLPGEQRRDAVAALEAVDRARLGHPEDFSIPIREIDPDVLVLGHDQHHDESEIERALAEWEIDCRVERVDGVEPSDDELYSSSDIVDRILAARVGLEATDGRPSRRSPTTEHTKRFESRYCDERCDRNRSKPTSSMSGLTVWNSPSSGK